MPTIRQFSIRLLCVNWNRVFLCLVVGFVACLGYCATASGNVYYGVQLGRVNHAWNQQVGDNIFTGLGGRFGAYWDDRLAFEGRLFFGTNDQTQSDSFGIRKVKLNHLLGGYARWDVPVSGYLIPYAIGGISRAELADNTEFILQRARSVTGLSYGVGADYFYSDYGAVNVEWIQWMYKESEVLSVFQIGVIGRF